jgi:L-ribulose-5-phosphate 4-epimerase
VIVERFKNIDPADMSAVLVHSHGPFVWGSSGRKAVEIAFALEIAAEMAMKSLYINPNARPVPQYLLDRHYKRKHGPGAYYGQGPGT